MSDSLGLAAEGTAIERFGGDWARTTLVDLRVVVLVGLAAGVAGRVDGLASCLRECLSGLLDAGCDLAELLLGLACGVRLRLGGAGSSVSGNSPVAVAPAFPPSPAPASDADPLGLRPGGGPAVGAAASVQPVEFCRRDHRFRRKHGNNQL